MATTCLPKSGAHCSWTAPSHLAIHRKALGCREQSQSLHVEPVSPLLSLDSHLILNRNENDIKIMISYFSALSWFFPDFNQTTSNS